MNTKQMNILLADDDIDDRNFFKDALKALPLTTSLSTVNDGDELMNYLLANTEQLPHVLFLDINMPAKNGFELAEYDLTLRGSGELYGMKQWGLTDLGMEAIKNIKMVEAARFEAQRIISEDTELIKKPLIAQKIKSLSKNLHME